MVDSSPEVSSAVLAGLPAGWPLKHVVAPAKGIYAAMNTGIEAAKGEVLWFLNGGDLLKDPASFNKSLEELLSSPELDMICAACDFAKHGVVQYPKLPRETMLESLLYRNLLSHQAVLYKRYVMDRVGLFHTEFRISADYEHYLRCYADGMRAKCIKDRWVICDRTGASSVKWVDSLKEAARASNSIRDKIPFFLFLKFKFYSMLELLRVSLLKTAAKFLPFGWIRNAWIRWNKISS